MKEVNYSFVAPTEGDRILSLGKIINETHASLSCFGSCSYTCACACACACACSCPGNVCSCFVPNGTEETCEILLTYDEE